MDNHFPLLGILGGGQLGRMSAAAAIRMGASVRTLSPTPAGPVEQLGEAQVGDWTDPAVLRAFADGCTAITVESEWAPAEVLQPLLPDGVSLYPTAATLEVIRDKGVQKTVLANAGLPVPPFELCASLDEVQRACARFGFPVVCKRFRGSYDGYGNATVESEQEASKAWDDLADDSGLLVEAWVPFEQELSVLVARRAGGQHVVYPVAYTEQRDHRCHAVVVPASVDSMISFEAQRIAIAAAEAVDAVGMLGVELFLEPDGRVSLNELAPRPHNTGHYTIEGSHTSQFENHVRAVLDWPLGDPSLRVPAAAMINILGHRTGKPTLEGYRAALEVPGAAVHIYGKADVKPRRKMGHVTVTADTPETARAAAERAASVIML